MRLKKPADQSQAIHVSQMPLAEARWQAVTCRDPQVDGQFFYAVKTTGIYCRPSCPSRSAKRQNVEFFDTADLAVAAGYRACKRCKPDMQSQQQDRNALVLQACQAIENSTSALSLEQLAQQAQLSRYHFHRIFKHVTGLTPKAYQQAVQAKRIAASLQSAPSITDAIYDAGFNSSGRFYDSAHALLGMQPRRFREGGRGECIRYEIAPCVLGWVIVAATRKGVCAIEFGDVAQTLSEQIHARFHQAKFEEADAKFKRWVAQVIRYLDQPQGVLSLPLDIRGTVFQRRVWQAMQAIPAGQTASYSEVAERIGQPKAFRAVAHACACNAIAVAIPCHRVIRSNGNLSEYRWGSERKAELLKRERKK